MARRVPKPLTPVLVGVVAVVLGLFTVGTSFAGSGGVIGDDGGTLRNPHATTAPVSVPPSAPADPTPALSTPATSAPALSTPGGPKQNGPKAPKPPKPGSSDDSSSCSNCLGPPD